MTIPSREKKRRFPIFYAYLLTAAVLSLAAVFFLKDAFMTYRSSAVVHVQTPDWNDFSSSNRSVSTIVGITETLSFYEKVTEADDGIIDNWSEMSNLDRKRLWSDAWKIRREGDSSLLELRVESKDQIQSLRLLRASVKAIGAEASILFPDSENKTTLRFIDGPFVGRTIKNIPQLAGISLASGFGSAALLFGIFAELGKIYASLVGFFKKIGRFSFFSSRRIRMATVDQMDALGEKLARLSKKNSKKRATPPENLPIAEKKDDLEISLDQDPEKTYSAKYLENIRPLPVEKAALGKMENLEMESGPTGDSGRKEDLNEIYKQRLNNLLKGDL